MPLKTIKIPEVLFRAAQDFRAEMVKDDGGEMSLSIASEEPYKRYDWMNDEEYYEVLSHTKGDIDDSRMRGGMSHLFNHDRDAHIGRSSGYEIKDGKCYVTGMKFAADDFAQNKKKDIQSGVLPDTSVGYKILDDGECIGAKDGLLIYKFKWAPHEFSSVTIPADPTVGANREDSSNLNLREFHVEVTNKIDGNGKGSKKRTTQQRSMATPAKKTTEEEGDTLTVEIVEERAKQAKADAKARAKQIRDYTKAAIEKKRIDPEKARAIEEKFLFGEAEEMPYADYRDEMLGQFEDMTRIQEPAPKMGLSNKDMKSFRWGRDIIAPLYLGEKLKDLAKEVTEWTAKTYQDGTGKIQRSGVTIPDDFLECEFARVHDLDTTGIRNLMEDMERGFSRMGLSRALNASNYAAGGALVAVELMAGAWIELLRNQTIVNGLGITELSGLVGNIAIPKQTGAATCYWGAEGQTVAESDQTLGQIYGTPHRLSADTAYTLQLANQSSLPVEAFIRNDLAKIQAIEEDRVAYLGGVNPGEPIGVLNTTGVGAGVIFSGNATRLSMTQFEFDIANANALIGPLSGVTSPQTKYYLQNTLEVEASTFPIFLWKPGMKMINGQKGGDVIGVDFFATKNMTTNQVIVGVWSEFIKFRWAGLNMVVDPYTLKRSEEIEITIHQWLDQNLRYPVAFDTSTDAPTEP